MSDCEHWSSCKVSAWSDAATIGHTEGCIRTSRNVLMKVLCTRRMDTPNPRLAEFLLRCLAIMAFLYSQIAIQDAMIIHYTSCSNVKLEWEEMFRSKEIGEGKINLGNLVPLRSEEGWNLNIRFTRSICAIKHLLREAKSTRNQ